MRIAVNNRHQMGDSPAVVQAMDSMIARLSEWSAPEHDENGGHGHVTAMSTTISAPAKTTRGLHVKAGVSDMGAGMAASGHITPPTLTADVNNYTPDNITNASIVRLSSDASRTITGLQDGARLVPLAGRMLTLRNIGANDIVLEHEGAASSENFRFELPGAADITLTAGHAACVQYDPQARRWFVVGRS